MFKFLRRFLLKPTSSVVTSRMPPPDVTPPPDYDTRQLSEVAILKGLELGTISVKYVNTETLFKFRDFSRNHAMAPSADVYLDVVEEIRVRREANLKALGDK